ncbi:hypothetical protein BKA69DRAFT_764208 [Paraphysoderma sedebokerense]|nr:hypothetical protein BKA69DRAFT_764208 [Paraphysoderma sedebokerense]
MKVTSIKIASDVATVEFFVVLLICFTIGMHPTPELPTPWYLNTTASVNLLAGSTIIDTCALNNSDYYAITGVNGSSSVGLYRYKVGTNGWGGINTTLGAIGWAYDNERRWSTASLTVNPWTTIPYIAYVYSNYLVFQQYAQPDIIFNDSSNAAISATYTVDLPRVVPNPHIVLHWADSSTLALGIHPYTAPAAGIQANFIIGRFQVNTSSVLQQAIHGSNELVYSIEFECSACSADIARLSFSNGTMRYLMRTVDTYSWSSLLSPIFPAYASPELSHKCYDYPRNTTFLFFRAPPTGGNEQANFQKIFDSGSVKGMYNAILNYFV